MTFHKIILGDCMKVLPTLESESVNMIFTSPPYWGLRDYGKGTETIFGGDKECEHEWSEYSFNQHSGRGDCQKSAKYSEQPSIPDMKLNAGFCSKCGAWKGQLGLEPTFQMYVQRLVEISRELKRVLRKDGSYYLVIGDTYAGSGCGSGDKTLFQNPKRKYIADQMYRFQSPNRSVGLPSKCLIGIPWRVVFALIDDGWILRNDVIWNKPNAMPSSVKDRLTNRYEHIFHLVRSDAESEWYLLGNKPDPRRKAGDTPEKYNKRKEMYELWLKVKDWWGIRGPIMKDEIPEEYLKVSMNLDYYYDLDAIRESHSSSTIKRATQKSVFEQKGGIKQDLLRGKPESGNASRCNRMVQSIAKQYVKHDQAVGRIGDFSYDDPLHTKEYHPKGKNPGDVLRVRVRAQRKWSDPKFGTSLPTHVGNSMSHPLGKNPGDVIFQAKKEPYLINNPHKMRLRKDQYIALNENHPNDLSHPLGKNPGDFLSINTQPYPEAHFAVFPEKIVIPFIKASCPKDGTVLDPLAGSGTVAKVARDLGRSSISIEINPDYINLIKKRLDIEYQPLDIEYEVITF